MTVSDYIIDFLLQKGVKTVFAYPGANVLRLYARLCESSIRIVLTRHEQGAIHAAAGYAKATGKVGVCIATSGPGAANLITGIADANLDSSPLLVITGQVPSRYIGRDAFQEADILGITIPVTKHNYLVTDAEEVPRDLEEAWRVAESARQGPVLVDITSDLFDTALSRRSFEFECLLPRKRENHYPLADSLDKLREVISSSFRPLVLAGGGVVSSGASQLLRSFCERSGIPCVVTMMGKGLAGAGFENLLGMAGLHGNICANTVLEQCDLLIAIGCRFSDRTVGDFEAFSRSRTIVHCDIDPAELNKNLKVYLPVCADCSDFLSALSDIADDLDDTHKERYSGWYTRIPPVVVSQADELYKSVCRYENENPGSCIVTDVGTIQTEAARLITVKGERAFVTSGGLGAMGFGLPGAIGASFALYDKDEKGNDGRRIILIAGDGGFQMTLQELGILSECPLPIKIIIMNNRTLGMVNDMEIGRGGQYLLGDKPDFSLLAKAYGVPSQRIALDGDSPKKVLDFLSEPESSLLEIIY
ncbi:MAG: thiamine pyrophosphate-binding protein [Ruminococcaceae bacterium]|nr:thiamine pyrophosphate-binding protein [Oscillospiraceae bacterium]